MTCEYNFLAINASTLIWGVESNVNVDKVKALLHLDFGHWRSINMQAGYDYPQ
jgi:hypothetical protein